MPTVRRYTRRRLRCAASHLCLRRRSAPARCPSNDAAGGSDAAGRTPAADRRVVLGRLWAHWLPLSFAELAEVGRTTVMVSGAAKKYVALHPAVGDGAFEAI